MKPQKYFLILFLILFVLGCGKKEEEIIKIGAILPLTGEGAVYGEAVKNAAELAIEKINKQGGINGNRLMCIYEDSQGRSELAVRVANKLIDMDNVNVIVGALSSSEVLAIAPILNKKQVILISPAATNNEISNAGEYIFRTIVSDIYDGAAMAKFAIEKLKIKSASVFYLNEAGPKGVANAFVRNFEKSGGKNLLIESCIRGDKNYRTQITSLKRTNSDAIYFALYPEETQNFVKQIRELNVDKILLTHQLIDDPKVLKFLGKSADGIYFTTPGVELNNPNGNYSKFIQEYKLHYKTDPINFTSNTFDAIMLISLAMKAEGINAINIKNYLLKVRDYNGASGIFSFDINGDIEQKMLIKIIENGKPTIYAKD
ncbi:MAG: hypothetical protein C4539_03590 [Ignavibacteriales bacterium]|nr:MAG: hypothetical protein C4539_03590 [Ignavibacteriales bacterium]